MLLDCNTLGCEYVPLKLGEYSLVIINCKKPHSLVESKYNERRAETDGAFEILRPLTGINCLAELSAEQLEEHRTALTPTVYKRVKHIVEECARVSQAERAMRTGDMKKLGELLNSSHASLKDLYEVTGAELDALAAAAQRHPACLGSRMTGGGFGGCTVSLVESGEVQAFKESVLEEYERATGYKAEVYQTEIGDGVTVVKM